MSTQDKVKAKHCIVCHDSPNEWSHQAHKDQADCCCCYEHLRRYANFDVTVPA